MKLLPFDLEKALAGAKVVTRDGEPVTQFTRFECSQEHNCCLFGVVGGLVYAWMLSGVRSSFTDPFDLFLVAPEPVVRWLNVYDADVFVDREMADYEQRGVKGRLHALRLQSNERIYGRALRVEIEPGGGE